jgi:Tol biopolymer transport system component
MVQRLLRRCLAAGVCIVGLYAQPADEPKLFADGLLPAPSLLGLAFSPDGRTLYFAQSYSHIVVSRFENGQWTAPSPMPFSGPYRDGDPFLTPDGSQLFFWSSRPLNGRQRKGLALWVSDRTSAGWSAPRDLGVAVNGPEGGSIFPSVTANGTLYFTSQRPDSVGGRDIYRARKTAEGYAQPENLGPAINSPQAEWDAYVAPDESFLVFASARPGGSSPGGDLYISTRKEGVWSPPRDLGPSLGGLAMCCPAVSPDGSYFFFSGSGGIYRTGIAALGLTPQRPSEAPKPFAEGTISVPGAFAITFSPDGNTAYFTDSGASIMTSRLENGKWGAPAPLAFSGRHTDVFPVLTRDGSQLFFTSSRRRPGCKSGLVLWTAHRTGEGWSTPQDAGAPLNTAVDTNGSGSIAANGTLYFAAKRPDSTTGLDLFRARRVRTGFAEPESLGQVVNSSADDREVAIAPDESFLIFTSDRPGGLGGPDLYVSARKDGAWTAPRNLGPKINSAGPECCAALSPDGRTLYFSRRPGGPNPGVYEVSVAALGLAAAASDPAGDRPPR